VPDEVLSGAVKPGERFRLGGMVRKGSVERGGGTVVRFVVVDTKSAVPVRYDGILPDLFSEGQVAVAEGRLEPDGVFVADTVLAKHDENYMPREVADALAKQAAEAGQADGAAGGTDKP
jgi:cytochrome c-type biogenesis protein CcmE